MRLGHLVTKEKGWNSNEVFQAAEEKWERVTPSGVYFGLCNFADRLYAHKSIQHTKGKGKTGKAYQILFNTVELYSIDLNGYALWGMKTNLVFPMCV